MTPVPGPALFDLAMGGVTAHSGGTRILQPKVRTMDNGRVSRYSIGIFMPPLSRIIITVLLLSACGEHSAAENETTPHTAPAPSPPTSAEEPPGRFAVHEWGLIAHHYADDEGPFMASTLPTGSVFAEHHRGRGGGKPILYVHLQEGIDAASFDLSLSMPGGGTILERLPLGESDGSHIAWHVSAARGSCSARERYPLLSSPRCSTVADHYCEAHELAEYETDDSACLTVDGEEWNHLFYRAQVQGQLPLHVSREGNGFMIRNTGTAALTGQLVRIHRQRLEGDTHVSVFDPPAPGSSVALPDGVDAPAGEGINTLRANLEQLGLTSAESEAFLIAWQADLFGSTPDAPIRPRARPPAELRPKENTLVYFVPPSSLDGLVRLSFSPEPSEVRRAMLVRVDLGEPGDPDQYEPPPAPRPSGLGSLRVLGGSPSSGDLPAQTRSVRLRFARLEVEGMLESEVVRRVLRRHSRDLRRCAEAIQEPDTDIRVDVRFAVGPTGAVQSSEPTNDAHSVVSECMANMIERMRFPSRERGSVLTQHFSITAQP